MVERDPRAMNNMDPETKLVHARLEQWARWARENEGAWPATTLLGRVVEEGPHGALQQGRPPISMPAEIAAVDAAVARLGQIDAKVIRAYYQKWAPPEVLARGVSMRVREFQNVLRRARWRIMGYLSAIETRH